jgi:hypothetical protein
MRVGVTGFENSLCRAVYPIPRTLPTACFSASLQLVFSRPSAHLGLFTVETLFFSPLQWNGEGAEYFCLVKFGVPEETGGASRSATQASSPHQQQVARWVSISGARPNGMKLESYDNVELGVVGDKWILIQMTVIGAKLRT